MLIKGYFFHSNTKRTFFKTLCFIFSELKRRLKLEKKAKEKAEKEKNEAQKPKNETVAKSASKDEEEITPNVMTFL